MNKKKIILIIILLIVICLVILLITINNKSKKKYDDLSSTTSVTLDPNVTGLAKDQVSEHIEYQDMSTPGKNYDITIYNDSKRIDGTFTHLCSYVNCVPTVNKYSVNLTDDEYNGIIKLLDKKEVISPIIEKICEDDKVFYESLDSSYEDSSEYNKMDSNLDGKVSSREFGDYWLNESLR